MVRYIAREEGTESSKKKQNKKPQKNEIQSENEDRERKAKEREVKCIKAIHDAPIKGSE